VSLLLPLFMNPPLPSATLFRLAALLLLGATAGCGETLLLQTQFAAMDTAGTGYGGGTGGGGQSYTTEPRWPVTISVIAFAARSAGALSVYPVETLTLTLPEGSTCGVAAEPGCDRACEFKLALEGPGPCVAQLRATTDQGPLSLCFSYVLASSEEFPTASDRALQLCGF
jgi:hypothetical protein